HRFPVFIGDDIEIHAVTVPVIEVLYAGKFRFAGEFPCCPKIDQHHPAPGAFEIEKIPVRILELPMVILDLYLIPLLDPLWGKGQHPVQQNLSVMAQWGDKESEHEQDQGDVP